LERGTYFFNRTVYPRLSTPVPECFQELDRRFGEVGLEPDATAPVVSLAENVCRRMGDIDFHAESIEETLAENEKALNQAAVVSTLLVAHLGACKAMLDGVALSLNEVLGLGRRGGNCDLSKGGFWTALAACDAAVKERYNRFRPLVEEVVLWRDSAVHRIAPLAIATYGAEFGQNGTVRLCLERDVDRGRFYELVRGGRHVLWGHPLHLHRQWRPDLIALCGEVCSDIAGKI
jgi:hypothetical protein